MRARRYVVALLIAVAGGLAGYAATTLRVFEGSVGQLEYKTIDYRVRSSRTLDPDSSAVRLVLFDSAYVASWPYLSPFPRAALATLVDAASQAGAKAIGLDVYLEKRFTTLDSIDGGDARLRDAIQRAGNVVLVGPTDGSSAQRTWLPPDPYFADVAAAVASADLPTPFETIRDGVLTVRTDQGLIPSFALALYAKAKDVKLDSLLQDAARSGELDIADLPAAYARLPDDATQTIPIFFEGPPSRTDREDGTFKALSGFAVASAAQFGAAGFLDLRDKIVIIGSGYHDSERFRTAFYDMRHRDDGKIYGWTYGAEIHAHALQNLLSSRFPKPLPAGWKLFQALAVAMIVSLITFARGAKWGAAAAALLAVPLTLLALLVFERNAIVVPMVGPALGAMFAFLGATSYVSIVEGKEKRMIKGAFGKYVSPIIVDQLVADPKRLKLGGERRLISVLFSDMTGFTAMSETMEPERLVQILNEYLDEMSDLVINTGGTLDKYIGDAIMAFYGAPTAMEDHASACCRTALQMQHKLAEMNERFRTEHPGWPVLQMRIGVNSGMPVVGNIGGKKRFDYTALGDAVNLAARLEPGCKIYGVRIMIGQTTREYAGDSIQVRELDMLAVYGKKEPIRVYELLGWKDEDLGARAEVLTYYNRGLTTFRDRDFELAMQYFKAALEVDPADGPSALYVERCEEYMLNPPPADWDYVERRQAK